MQALPFTADDIEGLTRLQPPDWGDIRPLHSYYVRSAHCNPFKIEEAGEMIGVGTTLLHKDTAWLAHIIVHEKHRKRGLGNFITSFLLKELEPQKFRSVNLLATPLGEPVYRKLGFRDNGNYTFFKKEGVLSSESNERIIQVNDVLWPQVKTMDAYITGEDREIRMEEHRDNCLVFARDGKVLGYHLPGLGEGFIGATDPVAGLALSRKRLESQSIAVIPDQNNIAVEFLSSQGFEPFRHATRMYLGDAGAWRGEHVYQRVSGQIG